jgi:phytol kinase
LLSWFDLSPELWLHIGLVGLWLSFVVLTAEGLHRFTSLSTEITRKVVHIGAGQVILLAWWLSIPAWIGLVASIVSSLVALLSYYLPILTSVNGIGRKSLGTFFYALSIGFLVAWFWPLGHPEYAAIGVLIMTWGDGLAALVGQRWGNHPYHCWGVKKSWEGSLTMALSSLLVTGLILAGTLGVSWQIWSIALLVSLVATLLEVVSKFGIDNFTVPLGSAALAFYLTQLFERFS